jgi:hypothetical protein
VTSGDFNLLATMAGSRSRRHGASPPQKRAKGEEDEDKKVKPGVLMYPGLIAKHNLT